MSSTSEEEEDEEDEGLQLGVRRFTTSVVYLPTSRYQFQIWG